MLGGVDEEQEQDMKNEEYKRNKELDKAEQC